MRYFNRPDHARGSTTIELVIFSGFLILTLIAAADFGRLVHSLLNLENAMRAGLAAGISLCGVDYCKPDDDGYIVIPKTEIKSVVNKNIIWDEEDRPYTFIIADDDIVALCRCPKYDGSNPSETGFIRCDNGVCDSDSCTLCEKPETYLEMTASVRINVLFYGLDVYSKLSDTPLEIERGPVTMAVR